MRGSNSQSSAHKTDALTDYANGAIYKRHASLSFFSQKVVTTMPTNVSRNLTVLQRHLSRNNYSRAANLMNELERRQNFVQEVRRVPGFSEFLSNLHSKAKITRNQIIMNPRYRHPNFPGAPARRLANFIPRYVDALTRNASAHARPNVNMGNAEAAERNAVRARAQRQANANRAAGRRIAEQAARNAARARNAAAAEANRLRRAASEANAKARANAVEASRREAAAQRAARNAAEKVARNAAERAARNVAAAKAARNAAAAAAAAARAHKAQTNGAATNAARQAKAHANAAAAAAARAHKAQTNGAATNAARQAKAHANAAAAAAAGGAGGSAGTNAANAAKKAAKNAEIAAATAAKMKIRENGNKAFDAQVNALKNWKRRFEAYKAAPHFMTTRQIISKMAKNHLNVNIPVNAVVTRRTLVKVHPDRGRNVSTKALRQLLSSLLGEYYNAAKGNRTNLQN